MFRTANFSLVFLILSCQCYAEEIPNKELHLKCLYPTVLLRSKDNSSFGSGVVIKSKKIQTKKYINYFLSSNHVVSSDEIFYAEVFEYEDWSNIIGKKIHRCYHYANNKKNDLYVGYFLSNKEIHNSKIDFNTKFYIGTPLFGIGCGLKDDPRLEYGRVSSPIMRKGSVITKGTVRASIHTVPGDSGGGVFNNRYQLVGITKAIKQYHGQSIFNVRYFVPLNQLKLWEFKENKNFKFLWSDEKPPLINYYRNMFTKDMIIK